MRLGGTIRSSARVRELIQEQGRVRGVVADLDGKPTPFRAARGVILATGDYANSPQIISQYKGPQFADIEGIDETATGDGHLVAQRAGAKLLNMDVTYGPEIRFVPPPHRDITQILPTSGILARAMGRLMPLVPRFLVHAMIKRLLVTWQHPENALFHDGAILVNTRGERFTNETLGPDREVAIAAQPGKICYILLDERLINRYSAWPHFISTAPKIAYAYVADYLRLRPDVAVAGSSLASVAARRGLPGESLKETIDTFNRYTALPSVGHENAPPSHRWDMRMPHRMGRRAADPWGRTGDTHPLEGSRWVLLGPAKAYFTTTEGGAAVNERMQVLDQSDRPIPGLYAAGQVGLGGMILWGHGLHIAWALTSGRLAGRNAASVETGE